MHTSEPFGGAEGKSSPSVILMRNAPPSYGVPAATSSVKRMQALGANPTGAGDGGLDVGDVLLVDVHLDAVGRAAGQRIQLARHLA